MKTHVKDGMSQGTDDEKERLITEMLMLYELSSVRG